MPMRRASVHPKSGYGIGDRDMTGIANALVALVAALHVYFLVLEMFLWTRPLGLKTFGNSLEKANDTAVLAANQGLYNGFLAAGLVWGLVDGVPAFAFQIKTFFLLCVIVGGVYRADFALVGVASSILHCEIGSSSIRANDGNRRGRKDRRTRPLAQSPHEE